MGGGASKKKAGQEIVVAKPSQPVAKDKSNKEAPEHDEGGAVQSHAQPLTPPPTAEPGQCPPPASSWSEREGTFEDPAGKPVYQKPPTAPQVVSCAGSNAAEPQQAHVPAPRRPDASPAGGRRPSPVKRGTSPTCSPSKHNAQAFSPDRSGESSKDAKEIAQPSRIQPEAATREENKINIEASIQNAIPSPAQSAGSVEESHPSPIAFSNPTPQDLELTMDSLIQGCKEGDAEIVRAFLQRFAPGPGGLNDVPKVKDLAVFDDNGVSALHYAAQSGDPGCVLLLLKLGQMEPDVLNGSQATPLQCACRAGAMEAAAVLLENGADPNQKDQRGLTPFLHAVFSGAGPDMLDLLCHGGADVCAQDLRGVSALHFAAMTLNLHLATWLISKQAAVDTATEHQTTPLILAAKKGHTEGVQLLLEAGANPNNQDNAGCTALMLALASGHVETALVLLDAMASVTVVDNAGRSAVLYAIFGQSLPAVKALVDKGSRVNTLDEQGNTPLFQACLMGQKDIVLYLLEQGADPNLHGRADSIQGPNPAHPEEQPDAANRFLEEAKTCLQVCVVLEHNDLLIPLLEKTANVDAAPGMLRWTALHLCAVMGNEEGALTLCKFSARSVCEDIEGNTAAGLAERCGHHRIVDLISSVASAAPSEEAKVRRNTAGLGPLPPISMAPPTAEPPADEHAPPLEGYRNAWQERESDGSLLDRVLSPLVHDAFRSDQWRLRWEALSWVSANFLELNGSSQDLVLAVGQVVITASHDKIHKVFLAALGALEELLSDARTDDMEPDEFVSLLRAGGGDVLAALLDATETSQGANSQLPQTAAMDVSCSCVFSGHIPLDDVVHPLLVRLDRRMRGQPGVEDQKETPQTASKKLVANFKLLGRFLTAFGLQQAGIFRRAIVLPLLLRGASSTHAKVRAASGEACLKLLAMSTGLEERAFALLSSKVQKALHQLADGAEGVALVAVAPHEEDGLPKGILVSEDKRAADFICMSELTPAKWTELVSERPPKDSHKLPKKISKIEPSDSPLKTASVPQTCPEDSEQHAPVSHSLTRAMEEDAETLKRVTGSRNWKDRAECLVSLAAELSALDGGVQLLNQSDGGEPPLEGFTCSEGPLLSQYVLKDHRLSVLQDVLMSLLPDAVIAVFVPAADLVRIICALLPMYLSPLFLEPMLPLLVQRLLDTSGRVKSKAQETLDSLAELHEGALSELLAQHIANNGSWGQPGAATTKAAEKSVAPRLQFLTKIVTQKVAASWKDEALDAVVDFALKAAEHRSNDVRHLAVDLLGAVKEVSERADAIAQKAVSRLQEKSKDRMKKLQQMKDRQTPVPGARPGTGASRPGTGAVSRLDTGLSKKADAGSRMGTSSGRLGTSSGRLGTSYAQMMSRLGTSSGRQGTSSGRLGSSAGKKGAATLEFDSDDESVMSVEPPEQGEDLNQTLDPLDSSILMINNPSTSADNDGEGVLKEVLPLAEALDEAALDFVSPLIAVFGEDWTKCFYSRNWQCRVAALTHLSRTIPGRVERIQLDEDTSALNVLLEGAMRAVHEGLGDQNIKVYSEACMSVSAVVSPFCRAVDGRLLVAHLAPLMRQLCVRMGDSKETIRTATTEALFSLLQAPSTSGIVNPSTVTMLILRHLAPNSGEQTKASSKVRSTVAGWLCRLSALRVLVKEYHNKVVRESMDEPQEWMVLAEGMTHADPTVRHESARLFVLACKVTIRHADSDLQQRIRDQWVAKLPGNLKPQLLQQIRKQLQASDAEGMAGSGPAQSSSTKAMPSRWDVPPGLAEWSRISRETLQALENAGDWKACFSTLQALLRVVKDPGVANPNVKTEEAFAGLCSVVKHVLSGFGSITDESGSRQVLLTTLNVFHSSVQMLAPRMSSLDVNMGLAKAFPVLLDKASGCSDMKAAVASDKLVRYLAMHKSVGCEAVTKMVISAVGRAEKPNRPLVWLHTLLSDFVQNLCGQKDIISLLLGAVGTQLERLGQEQEKEGADKGECESLRSQLVGVLAVCKHSDLETINSCLQQVDDQASKTLLRKAMMEAPDSRQLILGVQQTTEQLVAEAKKPPTLPADNYPKQEHKEPSGRGRRPRKDEFSQQPAAKHMQDPAWPKYTFDTAPSPRDASPSIKGRGLGQDSRERLSHEKIPAGTNYSTSDVSTACPSSATTGYNASPRQSVDSNQQLNPLNPLAGGAGGLWRFRQSSEKPLASEHEPVDSEKLQGDRFRINTAEPKLGKRAAVADRRKKRDDDSLDALNDLLTKIEKGRATR